MPTDADPVADLLAALEEKHGEGRYEFRRVCMCHASWPCDVQRLIAALRAALDLIGPSALDGTHEVWRLAVNANVRAAILAALRGER